MLLKSDMKSLAGVVDGGIQYNLHERVIQSGLDSLTGADAPSVEVLFMGMAVFAEDQIVAVDIMSVLWQSINPEEHPLLSRLKVRQWVSQLLSRSILLGSTADGVSMHDVSTPCLL